MIRAVNYRDNRAERKKKYGSVDSGITNSKFKVSYIHINHVVSVTRQNLDIIGAVTKKTIVLSACQQEPQTALWNAHNLEQYLEPVISWTTAKTYSTRSPATANLRASLSAGMTEEPKRFSPLSIPAISQRRKSRLINPGKLIHQINNSSTHLSAPSRQVVGFAWTRKFCGARSIIENKATVEA